MRAKHSNDFQNFYGWVRASVGSKFRGIPPAVGLYFNVQMPEIIKSHENLCFPNYLWLGKLVAGVRRTGTLGLSVAKNIFKNRR